MGNRQLSPQTRVVRRANLEMVALGDELGLMHPELGRYMALDPVGSEIWRRCEKELSISDLVGQLLQDYDVDQETCMKDVMEFVEKMQKAGLMDTSVGQVSS